MCTWMTIQQNGVAHGQLPNFSPFISAFRKVGISSTWTWSVASNLSCSFWWSCYWSDLPSFRMLRRSSYLINRGEALIMAQIMREWMALSYSDESEGTQKIYLLYEIFCNEWLFVFLSNLASSSRAAERVLLKDGTRVHVATAVTGWH